MDSALPPVRARARWMDEAEHEEALREAIDALAWACSTAAIAGMSHRTTMGVMHNTARQILEGLQ